MNFKISFFGSVLFFFSPYLLSMSWPFSRPKDVFEAIEKNDLVACKRLMREYVSRRVFNECSVYRPVWPGEPQKEYPAEYHVEKEAKTEFLNKRKIDPKENISYTPLWYAFKYRHEPICRFFLDEDPKPSKSLTTDHWNRYDKKISYLLHQACAQGLKSFCELFILKGAYVNELDSSENTPLDYSLLNEHSEISELLIARGANVNFNKKLGSTSLHLAAREENIKMCTLLLKYKAHVDARDDEGITPLGRAISTGSDLLVKLLLEHGADMYVKSKEGIPLQLFAKARNSSMILKILFDNGFKVDTKDEKEMTLLHHATNVLSTFEVLTLLLVRGADVNAADIDGNTPLHRAVLMGKEIACKMLIQAGAHCERLNKAGETPLHLAQESLCQILVENGATIDKKVEGGETPLQFAVRRGYTEKIKTLVRLGANINVEDKEGSSLLQIALERKDEKISEVLLSLGVGCTSKDKEGSSPLHRAVENNLHKTLIELLKRPVNVDEQDNSGKTSLHIAAAKERQDECQRLLEKGANVNAKDNKGRIPLHYTSEMSSSAQVLNLFLEKGGDINAQDKFGQTPLHVAFSSGNELQSVSLLEKGANVNARDNKGRIPLHYASKVLSSTQVLNLFLEKGGDINAQDNDGDTPLHMAVAMDSESLVKLFLEKGADINKQTIAWETPLILAVKGGNKPVCEILLKVEKLNKMLRDLVVMGTALHVACEQNQLSICQLLLESNFDPNECARGLSLLHRACKNNFGALCELFIERQNDVNALDRDGNTPLHLACKEGHVDIVELLLTTHSTKKLELDLRNKADKTGLMYALENKSEALVRLLVTYGAQVHDEDVLYAARYGLVTTCQLFKDNISLVVLNNLRSQLTSLVRGNDELIKLFGIYQSLDFLPLKDVQGYDIVPENDSALAEGLQIAQPEFVEQYDGIDKVSEPSQYGDVSDLVTE